MSFSVSADKQAPGTPLDSSLVNLRHFNANAIREYKSGKDFNYGEANKDFSPSLWDRFWNWFWSLFKGAFSNTSPGLVFKYIFIGLGCAAVIFFIVKLSGIDAGTLFGKNSKEIELPYSENLENIHQISFDEEINKALENKDFRLAVRLLYLKSLKNLSNSGKIKWEPEKTNTQYIDELKSPVQKSAFRLLTQRFEYVWYGSFYIDDKIYTKISHSFKDFNSIV